MPLPGEALPACLPTAGNLCGDTELSHEHICLRGAGQMDIEGDQTTQPQVLESKYTKFRNLHGLYPTLRQGRESSVPKSWEDLCWAAAKMPSYWKAARTYPAQWGMNRKWLVEQGLYLLSEGWDKVQERCLNCRVPNGMHGGVRGRLAN